METYSLSHKLTIPDALIASTALVYSLDLYTFNLKDFRFITGLNLYTGSFLQVDVLQFSVLQPNKIRMARYLGSLSDKMSDLQDTWDGHLVRLSAYKTVPKLFEMTINSAAQKIQKQQNLENQNTDLANPAEPKCRGKVL